MTPESQLSIREFFRKVYVPCRLGASSPPTINTYASTIQTIEKVLARDGATIQDIKVCVEKHSGRGEFVMWYVDLDSGQRITRATGRTNRIEAKRIAAKWTAELREKRSQGERLFIRDLSDELMSRFMAKAIRLGQSVPSVNKHRRHLSALWRLAYERRLVETPCCVRPYREPKRQKQAWLPEEFAKILQAAAKQPGYIGAAPAGVWWCAFLYLAVNTGVRVSALMTIRTADCDLQRRHVLIRAETQKQNADQQFDLWPETAELLGRVDSHGRGVPLLLGDWKADRTHPAWPRLTNGYHVILMRAALPHTQHDLFHKLRRTFATWLVQKTKSIDRCRLLLGHSCTSVTERYLDWRQIEHDNVSEIIEAPALPAIAATVLSAHDGGTA